MQSPIHVRELNTFLPSHKRTVKERNLGFELRYTHKGGWEGIWIEASQINKVLELCVSAAGKRAEAKLWAGIRLKCLKFPPPIYSWYCIQSQLLWPWWDHDEIVLICWFYNNNCYENVLQNLWIELTSALVHFGSWSGPVSWKYLGMAASETRLSPPRIPRQNLRHRRPRRRPPAPASGTWNRLQGKLFARCLFQRILHIIIIQLISRLK